MTALTDSPFSSHSFLFPLPRVCPIPSTVTRLCCCLVLLGFCVGAWDGSGQKCRTNAQNYVRLAFGRLNVDVGTENSTLKNVVATGATRWWRVRFMPATCVSATTCAGSATAAAATSTQDQRATLSDGMTRRASHANVLASWLLRRSGQMESLGTGEDWPYLLVVLPCNGCLDRYSGQMEASNRAQLDCMSKRGRGNRPENLLSTMKNLTRFPSAVKDFDVDTTDTVQKVSICTCMVTWLFSG